MGRHAYRFDEDAADDATRRLRRLLRVLGVVLIALGGVAVLLAGLDVYRAVNGNADGWPDRIWLAAIGFPVMTAGSACLTGHVLEYLTRVSTAQSPTLRRRIIDAVDHLQPKRPGRPDAWRRGWFPTDTPSDEVRSVGRGLFCRQCASPLAAGLESCDSCGAVVG